jgi:hypothetical protein
VVVARERGDEVLTSDLDDLATLSALLGRGRVRIRTISELRA